MPFSALAAAVNVAAEVLGPLALIIGLWPRWTAAVLIGCTVVTLWLTHRLTEPLAAAAFEKAAGFLRKRAGRTELPVRATRFQREFPAHVAMMRELRRAGLARTEGGEQPKLTIKAPSAICRTGRVYCIAIDTATA